MPITAAMNLVSCADTVKVWELPSKEKAVKSFRPHTGPTHCVRWNHTNQVVASCSYDGSLALSLASGGNVLCRLGGSEGEGGGGSGLPLNSLALTSDSRYCATGGESGLVTVWSLRRKAIDRILRGHPAAINTVAYNWDNTLLASGGAKGHVVLHNAVARGDDAVPTMLEAEPSSGGAQITDTCFSTAARGALGLATDDGCVALWDAGARARLAHFAEHRGVCTSLAFSPLNALLLASGGMDGRVCFYDAQVGATVKTQEVGEGVTCLAFLADGVSLALGTATGSLLLYDLRNTLKPVADVAAHVGPVRSVAWQHSESPLAPPPAPEFEPEPAAPPPAPQLETYDSSQEAAEAALKSEAAAAAAAAAANAVAEAEHQLPHEGYVYDPDTRPPEEASDGPGLFSSLTPTSAAAAAAAAAASYSAVDKTALPPLSASALGEPPSSAVFTPSIGSASRGRLSTGWTPPGLRYDPEPAVNMTQSNIVNRTATAYETTGMRPLTATSQSEAIREIVQEGLAEFRLQLHRDVQNMHVEMLRQFHIQQNELVAALQKFSLNEALLEEVQRLRAENTRLQTPH